MKMKPTKNQINAKLFCSVNLFCGNESIDKIDEILRPMGE